MKKTLIIALLFVYSSLAFAQSVYKPGLIVRNGGDTLKGFIDYGNWEINPEKIGFKKELAAPVPMAFTVADISWFEVTGLDAYKRATVTKDMRPIDPLLITASTPDSSETVTAFLRVLVSGKRFQLYDLVDFKPHYYLQPANDTIRELIFRFTVGGDLSQVREEDIFKSQVRSVLTADELDKLGWKIDHMRYYEASLSKVILALNGSKDPVAVYGQANAGQRTRPRFFVSAGVGYSGFSVRSDNPQVVEPTLGMDFKSKVIPAFSVGMDLASPRRFNNITFRLELTYTGINLSAAKTVYNYNYSSAEYETYTIKYNTFSPSVSLLYNFNRMKKTKFYVGMGLAYNISSYPSDRYTMVDNQYPYLNQDDPHHLDPLKFWPMVSVRAGVRLNPKMEIGLSGNVLGSFTDFQGMYTTPRTYLLKFSYFL